MKISRSFYRLAVVYAVLLNVSIARGQQDDIPAPLRPWQDWVTWEEKQLDCPTPYNSAEGRICFWPSRLSLTADQDRGAWQVDVTVFSETWIPLPGSSDVWPLNVRAGDQPVPVVVREAIPTVQLPAGQHRLAGDFQWDEMPQRIAVPKQIGILSLTVEGNAVPIPKWDAQGHVWLKRLRAEEADEDALDVKVYRVIEDGIPTWLRTEIELTVSGKSREEQLGWILPRGWKLSMVESPIPVAVNDQGLMKAQVRSGKWTIHLHAFRSNAEETFAYAADAKPLIDVELIGFKAAPQLRIAEVEGLQVVDVSQTTFPKKWAQLPVYLWNTDAEFQLVEKMRGMGSQRPEGLSINRHFWLDEDGNGFIYRDQVRGTMQQIWRLDVAAGQEVGAVRVDGEGQLITAHPDTGAHGVEIRNRNLNMEAIGRVERTGDVSATGWQTDVDSLRWRLTLPPGWRVFALFGADGVEGDWLTAWTLLDLFLLLIFSLAVFRLWGVKAGIVAFLAFGLAYHEPGMPRYTWFFLLMPLALLRVMPEGIGKRLITFWKYAAVALLLLFLIPFVVLQVQSAIYPQLETSGMTYGERYEFLPWDDGYDSITAGAQTAAEPDANMPPFAFDQGEDLEQTAQTKQTKPEQPRRGKWQSISTIPVDKGNMLFDSKARIQMGPARPQWNWNDVTCHWDGPVSADHQVKPIYISQSVNRVLTVVRVLLLMVLVAILFGARRAWIPVSRHAAAAALLLGMFFVPQSAQAQLPDKEMLDTLRARLLEPSDAYPHAAEIPAVSLKLDNNKIVMEAEIHAAIDVAVPLPGRLPAWSPLSVKVDDQAGAVVRRHNEYLWLTLTKGVHNVTVEGLLPDATEWEWSFLLKPRTVAIDAPGWTVTGVRPNGVPEQQVFFARQQRATAGEAAYDQKNFHAIVSVDRHLEVGLLWKVRNVVTRLSSSGKAVSLRVPLLPGERVLTSNVVVKDGLIDVRLGSGQTSFTWESELSIAETLRLEAQPTDQWVEGWHLVTSPVWNVAIEGLGPVFESSAQSLVPLWRPWPGEGVTLSFTRPKAISGDTITVQRVHHEVELGARQRTSQLRLDLDASLGGDFIVELDANADISSFQLQGKTVPVRRDGRKLFVPVRPGAQSFNVTWRSEEAMQTVVDVGKIELPVDGSNVTTVMTVPESRWVLWADGPLRGPAVRFWTILVVAILMAVALGSVSLSPLRRIEWVLLGLGLTQVNVVAAMLVVGWLFLLAWRGREDQASIPTWRFLLLQLGIVLLTFVALGILVAAVGKGLLGEPVMFIVGNGSSQTYLQWYQPRIGPELPEPYIVSVSVWFYRLFMLFWALWLAASLLRWLKWGWTQFSQGGVWRPTSKEPIPATIVPEGEA